jgi:flagellar FliJ protein
MSDKKPSLKIVQKVREIQEKQAQRELKETETRREKEHDLLKKMEEDRRYAISHSGKTKHMRAGDMQTDRAFLQRLSNLIQHQKQRFETIQAEAELKRLELIERSKNKKMIEKLEEKREGDRRREADKKEQDVIDVVSQRPEKKRG